MTSFSKKNTMFATKVSIKFRTPCVNTKDKGYQIYNSDLILYLCCALINPCFFTHGSQNIICCKTIIACKKVRYWSP